MEYTHFSKYSWADNLFKTSVCVGEGGGCYDYTSLEAFETASKPANNFWL